MSRTPLLSLAAVLVLTAARPTVAAPVPADAGKAVTFPFPAKAPLVVQIHGLERTVGRVKALVSASVPDFAGKINPAIDDGLKQLLQGRTLTAISKDGRAYLVVHDLARIADDDPAVSLILPVADAAKFRETFLTADERKTLDKGKGGVEKFTTSATGQEITLYLVDLKEHVVLSPDKATAEGYAKQYDRATTATLGAELTATFVAADVGLYVNLEAVNDLYADQIRQGKGLLDLVLGQPGVAGQAGLDKKQMELAKKFINGAFQGLEDARGAVFGVEFREAGFHLRAQGRFADDSKTGRFLKAEKPGPLADLGKLPKGLASYGASALGASVADLARLAGAEFSAPEDDEKAAAAVKAQEDALAAAGPTAEFTAATTPGATLTVADYRDPAKAAAALVGLYRAVPAGGRVQNVVVKEKPAVTEGTKSKGAFALTEVKLVFDFDATVKDLPEQGRDVALKMFKRMVPERLTVWVGTDGKRVLKVAAADWAAAEKVVDAYLGGESGVGTVKGFEVTRSNLPPRANLIGLAETGETLANLIELVKGMAEAVPGGLPVDLKAVKVPKGEPTFVGFAVTLKAEAAAVDVFVPAAAVGAAVKALAPAFKNIE